MAVACKPTMRAIHRCLELPWRVADGFRKYLPKLLGILLVICCSHGEGWSFKLCLPVLADWCFRFPLEMPRMQLACHPSLHSPFLGFLQNFTASFSNRPLKQLGCGFGSSRRNGATDVLAILQNVEVRLGLDAARRIEAEAGAEDGKNKAPLGQFVPVRFVAGSGSPTRSRCLRIPRPVAIFQLMMSAF